MAQYPPNPAWKPALASSLSSQPVTFFQLATVSAPLTPHCRTLTLSGFFGEMPYAAATAIAADQQNPPGAESDILYVASDGRSQKFAELEVSQAVEAVFFFPGLWSQFRIRGSAFPISAGGRCGQLEQRGRSAVAAHMLLPEGWDWEKEVLKVWERQDKTMIKSKYPVSTAEKPVPDDFRLLVIVPEEVQQLLPGDNKALTWTATTAVNGTAVDWVCIEDVLLHKRSSKL
ncbi:pyridoxamine 5'-phosphate oxidase-domain-containing protein [Sphaerosporella brunnea]|uniref:Pyridoxamine 5'-phosphate oxidase-domain-containing protein n=1 Tax=Sphaerosporella brunnea TaxID=1250544 RepID=A0A5J5ETI7_9PEZI|nr:pyridoxamine 5'-phosphate oxidase-domain-containing protein [Sphaerosporella brunnea]